MFFSLWFFVFQIPHHLNKKKRTRKPRESERRSARIILSLRCLRPIIITALLTIAANFLQAQCALSGLSPTYCANSSTALISTSAGGTLTGPGLIGHVFSPSMAGIGTHTLQYDYCPKSYSLTSIPFSFTTNGSNVIALSDNEMSSAIPIGFPFQFFCNTYTDFYFSSNGFITFSANQPDGCCQGLPLPAAGNSPKNMIALCWTDLNPDFGGTFRYEVIGTAPYRSLVIAYSCIFHHNNNTGGDPITGYIVLYETTNVIELHLSIKPAPVIPINTTIGIQDITGTIAFAVPNKNGTANWPANNEAYRFTPEAGCMTTATTTVFDIPKLNVSASRSSICEGESTKLTAAGAQQYLWPDGSSSPTLIVSPFSTTVYTITGSNSPGCASNTTVQVNVSKCSSLKEYGNEGQLLVYPNPVSEYLNITTENNTTLMLLDSYGRLIRPVEVAKEKAYLLNVKELPNGIYFLCDPAFSRRSSIIVSH